MIAYSSRFGVRRLLLCLLPLMLAACGLAGPSAPAPAEPGGGASTPELAASNFFEDLRGALKDKQIKEEDRRRVWVEQLSGYFAPAERDDMRVALSTALDTLVMGMGELATNEELTLDLRLDGVEKLADDGDRAQVRPVNGSIYILITRTNDTGEIFTLFEQSKGLNEIIGSPDGAVPVVRIGSAWYLSEG